MIGDHAFYLSMLPRIIKNYLHLLCDSCVHISISDLDYKTVFFNKDKDFDGFITVSTPLNESTYLNVVVSKSPFFIFILVVGIIAFFLVVKIDERVKRKLSLFNYIVNNKAYFPNYQAIVGKDGHIENFEVLLRCDISNKIYPLNRFIHELEASNYLDEVFFNVLQMVIDDVDKHNSFSDQSYSFNATPSQIHDTAFIQKLISIDVPFGLLVEIVERGEIICDKIMNENIKTLKNAGIEIKLDDAGTGHANLSTIKNINVDRVKLDKFFCDLFLSKKETDIEFLRNVILSIKSVCPLVTIEGVESEKQYHFFLSLGIEYFQGYYFHKPEAMALINIKEIERKVTAINQHYQDN